MERIDQFKINPKEFQKRRYSNGSITFMIQKSTNRKIVCKRRSIKERELIFEVRLLSFCHHPAIVEFIGFSEQKESYNFYFVELEQGSLQDIINNNQNGNPDPLWDDTHKLIIAYGIARGMKYLHSNNILHRKLKLENILLDDNLSPYITDFGRSLDSGLNHTDRVKKTEKIFMPPEFLSDYEKYSRTKGIDVFAYSMILYSLWTEKEPYDSYDSPFVIVEKIMHNMRPDFPPGDSINDKWKQLICNCWDQDPNCRPTFDEICERLESPDFITSKMDKKMFDLYKEILDKAEIK